MAANPYLSHLPDQSSLKSKINYSNGMNGSGSGSGSAIDGFLPRKVNVAQCTKAMVWWRVQRKMCLLIGILVPLQEHPVNPFTGKPYSQKYRDILAKRKALPVFQQMGKCFSGKF